MKVKNYGKESGHELFYTDPSGKKVDDDLHSEMLNISPEGEERLLTATIARAKKRGISAKGIEALYGKISGYAKGGSVKMTKETARYRIGTNTEHCGICTMFREPDSCTAVSGKVRWMDTCKLFEKRK